jgi:hypothetical protein
MAVLTAPKTTYSDTLPIRRTVADLISIIDPHDTPIIAYFGIKSAPPSDFKIVNWPNTTIELLHDTLQPLTDALDGSITSTATTITVDDADVFHVGDVVLLDSEYLYLTARSASGEVWTVVRSFGGTTNASHADNAVTTVISNARIEGAESDDSSMTSIGSTKNYTQIIHEGVKVTRTQEKISQYGIAGEYERQVMKKTQEALRKLERAVIRGKLSSGSSTVARMMGGIDYWINSSGGNTVSAGGAVTQATFEDALEAAYLDGGKPRVAFVSPANMQVIKNIYDRSNFLRVERTETTIGMTVNEVVTPFGKVDLVLNRWMPDSYVPIIDPDHFAILAFEEFSEEELAKTGDYVRGQIVGEFTCLVRHPQHAHAEIISIS